MDQSTLQLLIFDDEKRSTTPTCIRLYPQLTITMIPHNAKEERNGKGKQRNQNARQRESVDEAGHSGIAIRGGFKSRSYPSCRPSISSSDSIPDLSIHPPLPPQCLLDPWLLSFGLFQDGRPDFPFTLLVSLTTNVEKLKDRREHDDDDDDDDDDGQKRKGEVQYNDEEIRSVSFRFHLLLSATLAPCSFPRAAPLVDCEVSPADRVPRVGDVHRATRHSQTPWSISERKRETAH